MAPSGLGTGGAKFGVALPTSGRSATVILRKAPAFRSFESTKAPEPVITSLIPFVEAQTAAIPSNKPPVIQIDFFIILCAPLVVPGSLSQRYFILIYSIADGGSRGIHAKEVPAGCDNSRNR